MRTVHSLALALALGAAARGEEGVAETWGRLHVGESVANPWKVDGRESRVVSRTRDGKAEIRVAVVADGALWLFELDRVENDAERAAFEAFLAGVDFDVR